MRWVDLDLRSANLLFRTIIKMLQLKESHIKVFFFHVGQKDNDRVNYSTITCEALYG
jgi:hypothetical protein